MHMKIKLISNKRDYYYRDLIGQEFNVTEKINTQHNSLYYIKGTEDEHSGNWFRKGDCKIIDKEYLDAIKLLKLEERLEAYKRELEENKKSSKLYEKDSEYKELWKGEREILYYGSRIAIQRLLGKINAMEHLLGREETM